MRRRDAAATLVQKLLFLRYSTVLYTTGVSCPFPTSFWPFAMIIAVEKEGRQRGETGGDRGEAEGRNRGRQRGVRGETEEGVKHFENEFFRVSQSNRDPSHLCGSCRHTSRMRRRQRQQRSSAAACTCLPFPSRLGAACTSVLRCRRHSEEILYGRLPVSLSHRPVRHRKKEKLNTPTGHELPTSCWSSCCLS